VKQADLPLVDTDVHERAELSELLPYLPSVWHEYMTDCGWTPDRPGLTIVIERAHPRS
jgi:hypothetical protein